MASFEVQRTVFNLADFTEVTLGKSYEFEPVVDVNAALARLGNDATRLVKVINDGLRTEQQRAERNSPDGWRTYTEDGELNGAAAGVIPADPKKVNALVLTLAKTVFGYSKEMNADQKRTAKESAVAMIRENDAIKAGLQKSAALAGTADEE